MTRPAQDQNTWRFELRGGRDLTLSISEEFKTISTVTTSDVKVELFYFPDPMTDQLEAPRHALQTAADALALFESLYGPYPHERMVVVQGDFPDGMEFSGLVFVSGDWFRTWQGIPNDWLTIITAHEISHQWWYAMVGNDQGNYPYIDEALAIYSEALFFEEFFPEFVEWWWTFRVGAYSPAGYVDSTVYEFYSARGYINAIYLRGAQMMQELRENLGDEAFFAWLSQYTQQMAGQLATPADFWGLLPSDDYRLTEGTRASYLRKADVLPPSEEIP
jgi:aminopeptidase N